MILFNPEMVIIGGSYLSRGYDPKSELYKTSGSRSRLPLSR